jgi:hypothetical protein
LDSPSKNAINGLPPTTTMECIVAVESV